MMISDEHKEELMKINKMKKETKNHKPKDTTKTIGTQLRNDSPQSFGSPQGVIPLGEKRKDLTLYKHRIKTHTVILCWNKEEVEKQDKDFLKDIKEELKGSFNKFIDRIYKEGLTEDFADKDIAGVIIDEALEKHEEFK